MRGGRIPFLGTLRSQISVAYSLLFAVAFLLLNLSVTRLVGEFLISQRTNAQLEDARETAAQFSVPAAEKNASALYALSVRNADSWKGRVLVLDMDGVVMADSHSALNGRILRHYEVQDVLSGNRNASHGFHRVDASAQAEDAGWFASNKDWAVYYTTAIEYQSRTVGVLLISVSIQDVVDLVTDAAWRFTVVALGVLAILIVLSAIVSRYISQPIAQMTEAIAQMGKGNLNVRTRARGNSEIAQMARTFDDMSGKLANAERQRQEFVANASHELKTPLSSIKILTESLLYRENVPEETYREFLSDINQQIDRLNTLLDDLLVLAQSERGDVVMHYTNESLNSLLDDCVKTLMPLAREKDISIYLPEEKVRIRCDRLKLNTALLNLLSNGIKYTPRGGSVGVSAHADGQWVTIRVWDTGVGIPEEDRAHIFERFYRVDKARSRNTGGTGLGLAIVQQITRLHGGEISLGDAQGPGTVFVVRLPQGGADA